MLYRLACLSAFASAAAFSPAAAHLRVQQPFVAAAPQMLEGRRAALLGLGALALGAPAAFADSIEDIAARSNLAAKADAEAKAAQPAVEDDNSSALPLIVAVAGGGTLASTAFYSKNLQRLGQKITTGKDERGK